MKLELSTKQFLYCYLIRPFDKSENIGINVLTFSIILEEQKSTFYILAELFETVSHFESF